MGIRLRTRQYWHFRVEYRTSYLMIALWVVRGGLAHCDNLSACHVH